MRILSITTRIVRWPIAGIGAARGRAERAAVLIEARSETGAIGLGEAAPLPGMSLDSLDDAVRAITALAHQVPITLAEPADVCALAGRIAGGSSATSSTAAPPPAAPAGSSTAAPSPAARAASSTAAPSPAARAASSTAAPSPAARAASSTAAPSPAALAASSTAAPSPAALAASSARAPSPAAPAASPAARFAIETALLDAMARERGVTLASLLAQHRAALAALHASHGDLTTWPPRDHSAIATLPAPAARRVPLAAVVDDPGGARRAFAAGIRCFKLKLTADDPLRRATEIAAAAPGARLRIDANRSWPIDEVADRLAALAALPVDYVEEPCRGAHRLLASPLAVKLALDESLAELTSVELTTALRSPGLAAIVLKPALVGGLSTALALAAQAQHHGIAAIASHALEGPIGTAACAELALALGGSHTAEHAAHISGLAPHAAHAAELAPHAAEHSPHAAGLAPHAAEFAPHAVGLAPHAAGLAPHTAELAPHAAGLAPHAAGLAPHAAGLASHAALVGWAVPVEQLTADHVRAVDRPGLGFADLDLDAAIAAAPSIAHPQSPANAP